MEPQMKRVTKFIIVTLGSLFIIGTLTGANYKSTTTTEDEDSSVTQFIAESHVDLAMAVVPIPLEGLQHEVYAAHASEEAEVVLDRTKPIYEVYKNGHLINVPAETQWIIRDLSDEYGFDERIIFGLALAESTFDPNAGKGSKCLGLYQISKYWIGGADIEHFTDDYAKRNLYDPYDATLTLLEMWNYAIWAYDIDISTEQGMKDLLYWHNTGQYIKNVKWKYSENVFSYSKELVVLQ